MKTRILFICSLLIALSHAKLLWQTGDPIAIYQSVTIGNNLKYVISGDGTNYAPDANLQVFSAAGNGKPIWTYHGTDFVVSASRHQSLIAAIAWDDTTINSTIYFWNAGNSQPFYVYAIPGVSAPAEDNPILVSHDGSRVVVAVTVKDPQPNSYHARFYWFDNLDSNKPVMDTYDCENATNPRNMALSGNGKTISAVVTANILVLDTTSKTEILNERFAWSADCFCMSPDGQYFAYGFEEVDIMKRNGNTYELLATVQKNGFIAGSCGLSNNHVLGLAYSSYSYNQLYVEAYQLNETANTALWSYTSPVDKGPYQNDPWYTGMSDDGKVFGVASWGDGAGAPTIQVFQTSVSSGPIFKYSTPGSVFGFDLVSKGEVAYVAAGGKHVHANVMGDGGDLFFFSVPLQ